jgi:hypothetical protein
LFIYLSRIASMKVCGDFGCVNLLLLFVTLFGCLLLFVELLGLVYASSFVYERLVVCA